MEESPRLDPSALAERLDYEGRRLLEVGDYARLEKRLEELDLQRARLLRRLGGGLLTFSLLVAVPLYIFLAGESARSKVDALVLIGLGLLFVGGIWASGQRLKERVELRSAIRRLRESADEATDGVEERLVR